MSIALEAAREEVVRAAQAQVKAADAEVQPLDHDEAIALYRQAQKNTEAAVRAYNALEEKT